MGQIALQGCAGMITGMKCKCRINDVSHIAMEDI